MAQFFAKPEFQNLKLSPSGKMLAVPAVSNGTEFLATIDLATMQTTPRGEFKDSHLYDYWWKSEDLLLMLVQGKDSRYGYRLLDLKTGKAHAHRQMNDKAYQLVNTLPDDPDNILVTMWRNGHFDLVKINLRNGKITVAHSNPGGADTWIVDSKGEPLALTGTEDKSAFLYWRKSPDAAWQRRALGSAVDPDLVLVYPHPDRKRILAWKYRPQATAQIVAVDLENMNQELIFESPEADPDQIEHWGDHNTVARGIRYETDRPRWHGLDGQSSALMATVDHLLPDKVNRLISTSTDGKIIVVYSWDEADFGKYYVLDLRAGRLQRLGDSRPDLAKFTLSPGRYFQCTARDGLPLSGRVYLPVAGKGKPPLVLWVGARVPSERADYAADPYVQLLTSRGYAVARINCRGTPGLGRRISEAGDRQLATGVPHDLEDGVRHLISQGLIDETRVVLCGQFGGGIVGFQALRHSSLFAAWINLNTPMDARIIPAQAVLSGERDEHKRLRLLGGKSGLLDYLAPLSPENHLAEIKIPSFHYYFRNPGDNTLRGDGAVAEKFFAKSPVPHVFVRGVAFGNYSDYWTDRAERSRQEAVDIFQRVLEFLDQYVPATRREN